MKHESVIDRLWATLRCFMECGNLSNAVSPALLRSHWICHPALHFHRAASLSIELTCHPAMPRNAPLIPTYNCFESFPPNVSKSLLDYATAWRCLRLKDFTRNSVKPICISTGIQVPIGTLWKIKRDQSAHRQKVAAFLFHWHKAWCSKVTLPLQHLYCIWQGHRLDV